jgi:hypothetical protein
VRYNARAEDEPLLAMHMPAALAADAALPYIPSDLVDPATLDPLFLDYAAGVGPAPTFGMGTCPALLKMLLDCGMAHCLPHAGRSGGACIRHQ